MDEHEVYTGEVSGDVFEPLVDQGVAGDVESEAVRFTFARTLAEVEDAAHDRRQQVLYVVRGVLAGRGGYRKPGVALYDPLRLPGLEGAAFGKTLL